MHLKILCLNILLVLVMIGVFFYDPPVATLLDLKKNNQEGQGLTILMADQMLRGLPITLAQSKAEDNVEKPKNKMRQLLHALYCSN